MRYAALRQFALSLPQTTVVKQWGECLVFKVIGKMFLLLAMDGLVIEAVIFKCTPEEFDELTENDAIIQAPYCAKRHWVRVCDLAALPADELERRISRSYDLVVAKLPKKVQATLGAPRSPRNQRVGRKRALDREKCDAPLPNCRQN
jgi:predicted DNA-binding protein (MmcQ/YjbR family)